MATGNDKACVVEAERAAISARSKAYWKAVIDLEKAEGEYLKCKLIFDHAKADYDAAVWRSQGMQGCKPIEEEVR